MRALIAVLGSSLLLSIAGCKATSDDNSFDTGKSGSAGSSSGGAAGSSGAAGSVVGGSAGSSGSAGSISGASGSGAGGSGITPNNCQFQDPNDTTDHDGDGWTVGEGDCNDCDANSNPGAIDVINYKRDDQGNLILDANNKPILADTQADEDCDGTVITEATPACDGNLQPGAVGNPMDAALAMGLCNVNVEANPADKKNKKWGVIQAKFVDIASDWFGAGVQQSSQSMDLNYGILPGFGTATKPQEGLRLFALSSGQARYPGAFGYQDGGLFGATDFDKGYTCADPWGFPKSSSCGSTQEAHDGVALDLEIRVPTNAKSFSFQFKFFTYEFPDYACKMYNDVRRVDGSIATSAERSDVAGRCIRDDLERLAERHQRLQQELPPVLHGWVHGLRLLSWRERSSGLGLRGPWCFRVAPVDRSDSAGGSGRWNHPPPCRHLG